MRAIFRAAVAPAIVACSGEPSVDHGGAGDAAPDARDRSRAIDPDDVDAESPDAGSDGGGDRGPPSGMCITDGWCWINPLPQGNPLHGGWIAPSGEVWAVGEVGTVLRYKATWEGTLIGTPETLRAVWGSSDNDVWAVGTNGTIAHWSGGAWTVATKGTASLHAIHGTAGNDIWAVGEASTILHYDGADWTPASSTLSSLVELNGVWAASASDAWAVGGSGTIVRLSGGTWSPVTSPTTARLTAVWGAGADDVWAAGSGSGLTTSTVLRFAPGTGWATETIPATPSLYGIGGTSASDVWAVGEQGTIIRFNAGAWSPSTSPVTGTLHSVVANGAAAWSFGHAGAMLRWSGGAWTNQTVGPTATGYSVLPIAADDVWTVGADEGCIARHWDGAAWKNVPLPACMTSNLWGSSSDDVWAVGLGGGAAHFDGTAWTDKSTAISTGLGPLFGTATNDLWTGAYGKLTRWNGVAWSTPIDVPTLSLYDGWSFSRTDAWVVGDGDKVLHYDGTDWTAPPGIPAGSGSGYRGVWGSAPDDVWIVGGTSHLRWRGATLGWSEVARPAGTHARSVWGSGPNDVWTVGGGIAHWNGSTWSPSATGVASQLWRVRGLGTKEVWAIGDNGALLRRR